MNSISEKLYLHRFKQLGKAPFWYQILVYTIVFTMVLVFLSLITKPLRMSWASNYIEAGDKQLLNKKYDLASLAYSKAALLNSGSTLAKERKKLVLASSEDISNLIEFFRQNDQYSQIQLYESVTSDSDKSYEMAEISKDMLDISEPQYAIIAAKRATEIDPSFRDGWLYLGISQYEAGTSLKADRNVLKNYITEAKVSLAKALEIDPTYQPTKDYLEKVNKLK